MPEPVESRLDAVARALQHVLAGLGRHTPRSLGRRTPSASGLVNRTFAGTPSFTPGAVGSGVFVQPDQTTCGSASLVMSRMLNDADFAATITPGHEGRAPGERFHDACLAMHARTNRAWPQALGTWPASLTHQMNRGSGVPGATYRTLVVDPRDLGAAFDLALQAVDAGHTVPICAFGVRRPLARSGAHVTLAVGRYGDDLIVYEPESGALHPLSRAQFIARDAIGTLGWANPLTLSLPA